MQVVYVNEYQPSSARIILGEDPIYKKSVENQRIQIRPAVAPQPILIWVLAAGLGIAAVILSALGE